MIGQVVRTVPGLRHVLDNGTIIFPPFPASELEPSIHQQELCQSIIFATLSTFQAKYFLVFGPLFV